MNIYPNQISLKNIYDPLAKWIKKSMRKSVCKHYFIGEKAYLKYSQYGWKMKAGPKSVVEFVQSDGKGL